MDDKEKDREDLAVKGELQVYLNRGSKNKRMLYAYLYDNII